MENEAPELLTFECDTPIEFANKETGEHDTTYQIFLRAPTYREMDHAAAMQQHMFQALGAMRRNVTAAQIEAAKSGVKDESDEERTMSGPEAMVILSTHGDLKKVYADFEKLALKVGSLNERTALVEKHFRGLTLNEIRRMCGEYIAFFIMPSVLAELEAIS